MMSPITLVQLQYLVAVATHAHFGRAAEACCVTQPTLSMQIQKVERQLGVVIFDRTHTPVIPTEVGRRIIAQAHVALREAARIIELSADTPGIVAGTLRVGMLPTLCPYLLPRLVSRLATRYPQLQIIVEELLTDTIVDRLREETLDIGVLATPSIAPDVVQWHLFSEPMLAYVNRSHDLAQKEGLRITDIEPQDLWLLSEVHCFGQQIRELCQIHTNTDTSCPSLAHNIRFESGNLEMLKHLVEYNGGLTLLPAISIESMHSIPPHIRIIPISRPVPLRHVSLAARRAYVKQFLVDAFTDILLESIPDTACTSKANASTWRTQKNALFTSTQ